MANFGAAWLGWDVLRGRTVPQFDVPDLHDVTMTPCKYGFHGTLKPPFRLKEDRTIEELTRAASEMAASLSPARCAALELTALGHFLALTPSGDLGQLQRVAEVCVRDLDGFRAPAKEAELARRRKAGLSARQEALLVQWGYPYVMEEFRFHLTLTGRLSEDSLAKWTEEARRHLPKLATPFLFDQIALCGEREDGRFELIHRYTLSG